MWGGEQLCKFLLIKEAERYHNSGQDDRAGIPSYLLHAGQGWDFSSSPEVKTVPVTFWDGVRSWRQVMPELLQDFEHDTIPFPPPFAVWALSYSFCRVGFLEGQSPGAEQ